jgi:tetratricopeptide (TPR) repeat protein
MTFLLDLLGMLAFHKRALRAQAGRRALLLGAMCFSLGFLTFGAVRYFVHWENLGYALRTESVQAFLLQKFIPAVFFFLFIFVPSLIALSNAIAGEGLGLAVSRQEFRAHGSVLLPLWGLLFLIDAPLQYYWPELRGPDIFQITIGMLVLLPLFIVYTVWAVRQLNYLTWVQAIGIFALSWVTWPLYILLTAFLLTLPFFLMLWLFYFGFQWIRGYFAAQTNEKAFRRHLHTLTLNPQDADAHYQLGLIHLKRANIDVARRYFKSALKIDPDDPDHHYSLGQAYESGGEWVKALEQYEETYRLNPEYGLGDIFREVGKGYLQTGNVGKAIEFLKFFLTKRGSDPEGRYWLALALQKSGDYEQMRLHLNTILEQARSNPRFFRKGNREWIYQSRALIRDLRFEIRD